MERSEGLSERIEQTQEDIKRLRKDAEYFQDELSVKDRTDILEHTKDDARERVAKLRQEFMLQSAICQEMIVELFLADDQIEVDELERKIQESGKVTHPEIIEGFIRNLIKMRKHVEIAALNLAEYKKEDRERIIYEWLLPRKGKGQSPQGSIEYEFNPLGVTVYIPDKVDYSKVNSHENSGGFFMSGHIYQENYPEGSSEKAAFIAINDSKEHSGHVLDHENNHSIFSAMQAGMTGRKRFVWGGPHELKAHRFVDELLRRDVAELPDSLELQQVIHFLLSEAKAELLADADHEDIMHYVENLKDDIYDFISKHLTIDKHEFPEHYEFIRTAYFSELEKQAGFAQEILRLYPPLQCEHRIKLFLNVLAQIPMENWERVLSRSMFLEEGNLLSAIEKNFENIYNHQKAIGGEDPKTGEFNEANSELYSEYSKLLSEKGESGQVIIDDLRIIAGKLDRFEKEVFTYYLQRFKKNTER